MSIDGWCKVLVWGCTVIKYICISQNLSKVNLSVESPNTKNQNKSMQGYNQWSVVLHFTVDLAKLVLNAFQSDRILLFVLLSFPAKYLWVKDLSPSVAPS